MWDESKCSGVFQAYLKRVMFAFVIIALICLSVFLVFSARKSWKQFDYVGKSDQVPYTISITGEGKVTAVPDIAKVSIGLQTDKLTVADAQKENIKKMNDIIAALKQTGVADKDIKTANYNIYPKYDWQSGRNNIVGYSVTQSLEVKIRDLKKISDVLKLAGEKGANQIGSLSFEIDEPDALRRQAREKAIMDAKDKAAILADSLGVKLGEVVSFSEYTPDQIAPMYKALSSGQGLGGAEMTTPAPAIQTGENEITVSVNLVYEIL